MANQLGISDALRGAVIAIQALVEPALMPIFAWLADWSSPIRVVAIGATFGIAANIAYATSTHVAGLFVGQILMLTVAQQLYPHGVGLASTVFMSSITLSGGLGGAIGGLGTALLGVPQIFFVPAVLTGPGAAWDSSAAHHREAPSRTPAQPLERGHGG
jgi:SET family sugar efflux transporter-like MFS transporter